MTEAEKLRYFYMSNIACGDIGEAEEARMLAEIAAAEAVELRDRLAAAGYACRYDDAPLAAGAGQVAWGARNVA